MKLSFVNPIEIRDLNREDILAMRDGLRTIMSFHGHF